MATLLKFLDLNFVGVLQPKPMHRFSPNSHDMYTPRVDLELIGFWGVSDNNCCHGNILKYFWVLKFGDVPQPKSMHGSSPNFQDMLTERRSRAD